MPPTLAHLAAVAGLPTVPPRLGPRNLPDSPCHGRPHTSLSANCMSGLRPCQKQYSALRLMAVPPTPLHKKARPSLLTAVPLSLPSHTIALSYGDCLAKNGERPCSHHKKARPSRLTAVLPHSLPTPMYCRPTRYGGNGRAKNDTYTDRNRMTAVPYYKKARPSSSNCRAPTFTPYANSLLPPIRCRPAKPTVARWGQRL